MLRHAVMAGTNLKETVFHSARTAVSMVTVAALTPAPVKLDILGQPVIFRSLVLRVPGVSLTVLNPVSVNMVVIVAKYAGLTVRKIYYLHNNLRWMVSVSVLQDM